MDWYIVITILCAVFLLLAKPLAYAVGLAFSRGYHRGKRESIKQILSIELDIPKDEIEKKEMENVER